MSIKHKLEWRFATKKFDSEKIVPEEQITELLEVTNLSASALGLQPYKFIVIHNRDIIEKLAEHSFNGIDVADASHLVVFASKTEVSAEYIDNYVDRTEEIRKLESGTLKAVRDLTHKLMESKSPEDIFIWSQKQAYVALGTLMVAAADLKVDMCPMEVINSEKYNEILGLDEQNLHACVVGVLGYRKHDDSSQHDIKSRKPLDEITELIY